MIHSGIPWERRFARRAERIRSSTIRELLKLTQQPGIISFAGGLPAPDLFPVEAFREASDRILSTAGRVALQYGPTEGFPPLRAWVAERMGVPVERVLLVSGSQQGLDFLGKAFLDPGDLVLVENPTYMGALSAFNPYEPTYLAADIDDEGVIVEELAELMAQRPKFFYVLPTFQNPSGTLLSLERRQALVELAARYQVPLIEDDAYAELYLDTPRLPSLFEIDRELHGDDGWVIYLSTFSKTLSPGLRVAWVVASPTVIQKLVQIKQGADLQTATFNQMLIYELARTHLEAQIPKIRATYRERRDLMLEGLAREMPQGMRWTQPHGGMFVWATLPEGLRAVEVFERAIARQVAFVPGEPFHARGGGERNMRLSYATASPEAMREGLRRLGEAIRESLD
jgi:2-aminoadipate transaminase